MGVASLSIRYNLCSDTVNQLMEYVCPANFTEFKEIDKELQFATAVTMFGLKVKQSKYGGILTGRNICHCQFFLWPQWLFANPVLQLVEKGQKFTEEKSLRKIKEEISWTFPVLYQKRFFTFIRFGHKILALLHFSSICFSSVLICCGVQTFTCISWSPLS